jgi:hypothetical protein
MTTTRDLNAEQVLSQEEIQPMVEMVKRLCQELSACQKVIHFADGFDPLYVTDARAVISEAEALSQEEIKLMVEMVEIVERLCKELNSCQRVIHFSGGFDPSYVTGARAAISEAEALIQSLPNPVDDKPVDCSERLPKEKDGDNVRVFRLQAYLNFKASIEAAGFGVHTSTLLYPDVGGMDDFDFNDDELPLTIFMPESSEGTRPFANGISVHVDLDGRQWRLTADGGYFQIGSMWPITDVSGQQFDEMKLMLTLLMKGPTLVQGKPSITITRDLNAEQVLSQEENQPMVEMVKRLCKELNACQRVIHHFAGGLDASYVADARAAISEAEALIQSLGSDDE